MHSLKKIRDSFIDRVKTPQAPRMGKIPLPEVGDHDIYVPSPTSEQPYGSPIILAPTPRKAVKPLSSLSRGATPAPPSIPTPALKQQPPPYHKYSSGSRSATPSPELKKTLRSTPAPEKPPMSPSSEKPPRSPHDEKKQRPSGERRGSKSSQESKRNVYRPAEGWNSLEMPGNTEPVIPAKDARPSKGILKPGPVRRPSEVSLHWQLLPPMIGKKLLYFDVTQHPNLIRDQTNPLDPVKFPEIEMEKAAAAVSLTHMTIHVNRLEHWTITPANPGGLSCRDVFEAIFETLNKPLTEEERTRLLPPKSDIWLKAQMAFAARCKRSHSGISGRLQKNGILRIDLLGEQYIFMGLTQARSDDHWVLELGVPNDKRKRA